MQIAIDKFGRVVIPKLMREHLGFLPGCEVMIEEDNDRLILQRSDRHPPVTKKKGLLVFNGQAAADLETAVQMDREQRVKHLSE